MFIVANINQKVYGSQLKIEKVLSKANKDMQNLKVKEQET